MKCCGKIQVTSRHVKCTWGKPIKHSLFVASSWLCFRNSTRNKTQILYTLIRTHVWSIKS